MKEKAKIFVLVLLSMTWLTNSWADEIVGAPTGHLKKSNMSFSCMECHKHVPKNYKKRKLIGEHTKIKMAHSDLWCFSCHAKEDRSKLILINGKTIPFKDMTKQCAQCHGPVYRDWKAGIHGKRTGMWNGKKQTQSCNQCHDPHNPPFQPMKPFAAPKNRFGTKPMPHGHEHGADHHGKEKSHE